MTTSIRTTLTLLLLLISTTCVYAQDVITGEILDADDGYAIPYASAS